MFGKIALLVLSALSLAGAQIPSLGFCPEYVPMANFDMTKVNTSSFLIYINIYIILNFLFFYFSSKTEI